MSNDPRAVPRSDSEIESDEVHLREEDDEGALAVDGSPPGMVTLALDGARPAR